MPEKATQTTTKITRARPARRSRKSRTCGHHCTTALIHGQCATCAGLVELPLRGEGGRFISLGADPTSADVGTDKAARTTQASGGGR